MSSESSSFRDFASLLKPHKLLLTLGMLGLIGGSGINLYLPQLLRDILNKDFHFYLVEHWLQTGSLVIGLFAIQGLFFFLRSYFFGIVAQKVVYQLRCKLYDSIIHQNISFFDQEKTGNLVSRLAADTQVIQDAISTKLSVAIRYSFQVIVGVGLMFALSWLLTVALLLILPIIIGLSIFLGKRLKSLSKATQSFLALSTDIAEESFGQVRIVKAFGKENFQNIRYQKAAGNVLASGKSRVNLAAFFSSFVSFLMNVAIFCVLLYGISLVEAQGISYGDLSAFLLYGLIVAVSFSFVASAFTEFVQALGAIDRVQELIKSSPVPIKSKVIPDNWDGSFTFQNVSFSYPSRPDQVALSDLNFTVEPGKVTALVGPSGAGKSTIVSLLLGFYPTESGSIKLTSDCKISDVDNSIRSKFISYVPQEPNLFAMSIADNLRFGSTDATDAELELACKNAQILDFIKSLPDGLNTLCGERGVQLSGGQKQRVAIARALLAKPRLLILDEATSALDAENENILQQNLATLSGQITCIVIAHRLSTIKNADKVLVIDQGKIIEEGNHHTLVANSGLYAKLVAQQQLGTNETSAN